MSETVAPKKLYHRPVMLQETLEEIALAPKNGWIVDGTFGDGGHSSAIYAQRIVEYDSNRLISVDWDMSGYDAYISQGKPNPILVSEATSETKWVLVSENFAHLKSILDQADKKTGYGTKIAALLLDLGISSRQLVQKQRGFSFTGSGKVDMRMSPEKYAIAAYDLLNLLPYKKLTGMFNKTVGMSGPLAAKLAREILSAREQKLFGNIDDIKRLTDISYKVVPIRANSRGKIHPATLLFLALRIAVNTELQNLQDILPVALMNLEIGGRMLIMTYHSGEEEVVSQFTQIKRLKTEIIVPSLREIRANPRARSAKLFIIRNVK